MYNNDLQKKILIYYYILNTNIVSFKIIERWKKIINNLQFRTNGNKS